MFNIAGKPDFQTALNNKGRLKRKNKRACSSSFLFLFNKRPSERYISDGLLVQKQRGLFYAKTRLEQGARLTFVTAAACSAGNFAAGNTRVIFCLLFFFEFLSDLLAYSLRLFLSSRRERLSLC